MKKTFAIAIILLLIQACFLFIMHNYKQKVITNVDTITTTKIDTLWKDTTITKTKYVPKEVVKLRTDTITKDTILTFEQKTYQDTICNDKDSIILKSFISGVSSKLDSTSVAWKKHTTVVTNTIEITKYIEQKKHLHFSPTISAGYDPINRNFGVMVGVGLVW